MNQIMGGIHHFFCFFIFIFYTFFIFLAFMTTNLFCQQFFFIYSFCSLLTTFFFILKAFISHQIQPTAVTITNGYHATIRQPYNLFWWGPQEPRTSCSQDNLWPFWIDSWDPQPIQVHVTKVFNACCIAWCLFEWTDKQNNS